MLTKVAAVITVLVVAGALSTVSVVLRMITRLSVLRTAGPDDWCMVAAQVLCIGLVAVIGFECKFGLGRHITEVPSDDALNYFKSFYASILIYTTALSMTKISLLLQYRRIFPSPTIRKTSLGFLIFVAVWTVALIIWFSLICIPIDKFWTPELPGVCAPLIPSFYTPAAVNIVTDCAIFIIPLPAIKTLKLPPRQKAILFGIFSIGFFVCGISFIRLYTLKVAADTKDSTWDNVDAAILSFLEVSMGILAGSLPTLRPLLGRIFPWLQYGQSQFTPSYGPGAHNSFHASRQSKIRATRNTETESTSALHHDDAFGLGNVKSVTAVCDAQSRDSKEVGSVTTKNSQNGIRATTTVTQQVTPRDMVG